MKSFSNIFSDPRWPRFLLVGGSCFILNLVILYGCTSVLGMHYLVSMLISILVVNTIGWLANRTWTFSSQNRHLLSEYARYLSVNLTGFLLSFALMALFVSALGIHYLLASAVIAAGLTIANFLLHRGWSFKKTPD
jgi:putative flippase GtrA